MDMRTKIDDSTTTVLVEAIVQDEGYQVRAKLDKGTINKYASAYLSGNELPPVEVVKIGEAFVLSDGWHRLEALKKIGRDTVQAIVLEGKQYEEELPWLAAKANLTHGLSLKSGEIRNAFRAYMKVGKYKDERGRLKSFRDIARELEGLRSHVTIRAWMIEDFPKIAKQYPKESAPHKKEKDKQEDDASNRLVMMTKESLEKALAAFKGIKDPDERGRLIKTTEETVEKMKDDGPWGIVQEEDMAF